MPRRMKTSTNLASSAITTRSQASARCIPPPAAVPLTPAMTGFSQSRMEVTRPCQPSLIMRDASPTTLSGASSGFGRGGSRPPRRSAPVQKAFSPAAVMTTTRTNRSDEASRTQAAIWSRMNWVMAFPASGRLRVIQQMPSSIRRSRSSPAGLSVVSLIGLLGMCGPHQAALLRPGAPTACAVPRQRAGGCASPSSGVDTVSIPVSSRRSSPVGCDGDSDELSATRRATVTVRAMANRRVAIVGASTSDCGRVDDKTAFRAELPGHDACAGRRGHRPVRGRRLHVAHRRAAAGRAGRVSRPAAQLGGLHRPRRQHLGVHGRARGGGHRAGTGRGRRAHLRVDAAGRPQEEAAHGEPLLRDPRADAVRGAVRPPGGVALRHGGPAPHARVRHHH